MKTIKFLLCAMLLMGSSCVWAQSPSLEDMTDKQASAYFQQKINELNAEIKLVNTKLKADKSSVELHNQLDNCKKELSIAKRIKKTIDTSIKEREKADKALAAAEKAMEKAEKAKEKAKEQAKKAETAAREALKARQ